MKNLNSKIIFFIGGILYFVISYLFFIYNVNINEFLNSSFRYTTYLFKNLEKNFEENNLILKFENNTFSINKDVPLLLKNYDQRLTNRENLVYIAQNAEEKDFKEKNAFMILNSKELKVDYPEGVIIYPIESLQQIKSEINAIDFKNLNQQFYEGSEAYNTTAFNLILILKSLEIFLFLLIGSFLVPFLIYGVLYISGYKDILSERYKDTSLIVIGVYLVTKPILSNFLFEPSFISVILIITTIGSIIEKNKLEKN